MAGAHEALRGVDVADGAAQVHAAGGDRDVVVEVVVLGRVDLRVVPAHVHGGLADLVEPMDGLIALQKSAGWWIARRGVALVADRPVCLHRNAAGQLHGDGHAAVAWPDGYAIYALHGVRVPETLAVTAASALSFAGSGTEEWPTLDREIENLKSSLAQGPSGWTVGGFIKSSYQNSSDIDGFISPNGDNNDLGGFNLDNYPQVNAWMARVANQPGHVTIDHKN